MHAGSTARNEVVSELLRSLHEGGDYETVNVGDADDSANPAQVVVTVDVVEK
jgi:hypothetical protein